MRTDDVKARRLVLRVVANVLAGNAKQVAQVLELDCTTGLVTSGRFAPLLFQLMSGISIAPRSDDPNRDRAAELTSMLVTLGETHLCPS